MDNEVTFVPIQDKILLTITEASILSGIGQSKLRELVKMKNCNFIIMNGTKYLLKRKQFEEYLNSINII